jgi:hypothetical protein
MDRGHPGGRYLRNGPGIAQPRLPGACTPVPNHAGQETPARRLSFPADSGLPARVGLPNEPGLLS